MIAFDVLRLPRSDDVDRLLPLICRSDVTRTIAWDGPPSEPEYRENWRNIVADAATRKRHFFTIVDPISSEPAGTCDVRPDGDAFRASLGLWIGLRFQSRGLGTRVVADLVRYGFEELGLCKLDAMVFCGNWASRRVFEKNGFVLEGTIRCALAKRGVPIDEWHLGLVNPGYVPVTESSAREPSASRN